MESSKQNAEEEQKRIDSLKSQIEVKQAELNALTER